MSLEDNIDYTKLREQAKNILYANDRGGYTVPNKNVYPYQWNWDSLFVALGWLTFNEERAWLEIEKLLEGQWSNGMVPSVVYHEYNPEYFPGPDIWNAKSKNGTDTTGITQMPVLVLGIELMYCLAKNIDLAHKKVSKLFNSIFSYQEWFYRERMYKDTGLVQTFHGWESMDNSPLWDKALERVSPTNTQFERKDKNNIPTEQRPKQWDYERYISILERMRSVSYDSKKYSQITEMSILDSAVNGVLQAGNKSLLRLVDTFGNTEQKNKLIEWERTSQQGIESLWNEELGLYVDYDVIGNERINIPTSGGLIPILAGYNANNSIKFKERLHRWITQDLPSVDAEDTHYEEARYWRGPSWTIVNFLIYLGTVHSGWHDEANKIKHRSLHQIAHAGFYENFIPNKAKGGGGEQFSWTAASYLYWLDDTLSFNFESIYK